MGLLFLLLVACRTLCGDQWSHSVQLEIVFMRLPSAVRPTPYAEPGSSGSQPMMPSMNTMMNSATVSIRPMTMM